MSENQKKPREKVVQFTTDGVLDEISFSIEALSGDIEFHSPTKDAFTELSYARAKSPKIVSRMHHNKNSASFDEWNSMRRDYDFCCAVDTNTEKIGDKTVSVTGIVIMRHVWLGKGTELQSYFKYEVPFSLAFVGVKGKQENFGWWAALSELLERNICKLSDRTALIVDSDLGNIMKYNEGTEPFYENVKLPPKVKLHYASSDVENSALLNNALQAAHSVADQIMESFKCGGAEISTKPCGSPYVDVKMILYPT